MVHLHNTYGQRTLVKIEMTYTILGTTKIKPPLSNSEASYGFLMQYWNMDMIGVYENFKVLFLDNEHRALVIFDLSKEVMTHLADKPGLLLFSAPDIKFASMIVAHNCPKGSLRPGPDDFSLTEKLKKFREDEDINVLDHLIINKQKYFSFADRGLL